MRSQNGMDAMLLLVRMVEIIEKAAYERVELGSYLRGERVKHSADDASECSTAVSLIHRTFPSGASTASSELIRLTTEHIHN